ncbi:MAG: sigma-54-dependent Fis family transcriptional regulator [Syntrophomonadales bacterium]|jgi:transcriptional regulator with PAS, ATPase and Fis domain
MRTVFEIWKSLRETGHCEGIEIADDIRESWARSEKYGVDPYKRCCDVILSQDELEERRNQNRAFYEQGVIMMDYLNQIMKEDAFIFFLQDADNYILHMIGGSSKALEVAGRSNLIEGSNWSERVMGTNVGPMAVLSRKTVEFRGYENYCLITSSGYSAASPIFNDGGKVIGVIGVSGPRKLVNKHTLGMVVAASRAIERQMALRNALQRSELENIHKSAIMESMSEGVLTLDKDNRVTHLNTTAARSLGIEYDNSVGRKLEELLYPGNEFFISKITGRERLSGETLIIKQGKKVVKLAVSNTPLIGKNTGRIGTVVILQPMQQYKRLIERVSGARANITFDQIIGRCNEFRYALMSAQMAAKSDSSVLLQGESGVGKDMFAQAIHNGSSRRHEPFFAINCAALPRELISSELFGYEDGAFTGARKGGNPGKFELADQGTIFLDEIGEMPLDLQGAFLRLLEEGTVVRLGGREVIPVNVRIIAASNKNLLDEVKKGNFRLDLYYRLSVMEIKIPSLRERVDDIPELVDYFIKTIGPKLGKHIRGIDPSALELLKRYQWPGNIRELSNVIERAINMTSGSYLTEEHFPAEIRNNIAAAEPLTGLNPTKEYLEEQVIRDCLRRNRNSRKKTAEELGISRATLYRKMLKYSID